MKKWWFTKWRLPIQLIVILAQVLVRTHGYSLGAGQQACSTMVPWHGGTPQNTPTPFEIKISQNTYQPLQQVRIDITSCGDFKFKGFLIQARLVQYYNQDIKIGVFGLYNNAPYKYTCAGQGSNGQALTHIDNSTKTNIAMVWQAPRVAQGHVMFRVTVVEDFSTYWVGAHSPIVWDTSSRVRFTQQQIQSVTTALSPKCKATTTQSINTTTTSTTTTTTTPTTTSTTTTTTTPRPTTTTTTTTPKPTTTTTTTTPRPTTTTPKPTTTTARPSKTTTSPAPPQMTTTTEIKEIKTTTVLPSTTTTTTTTMTTTTTLPPKTTTLLQKTTTDWLTGFLGDEDSGSTTRLTGNGKSSTVSSVVGMQSTTLDLKTVKPISTASSKDTTLLPVVTSTAGIQTSSLPPHLVRTPTTLHNSTGMVNNTVSNTESTTNVASTKEPDVVSSTTVAPTTNVASTKKSDVVLSTTDAPTTNVASTKEPAVVLSVATTVAVNIKSQTTTEDKFKSTTADIVSTTVPQSPTTLSTAETKLKSTQVMTSNADAVITSTTASTTSSFISTKDLSTTMSDNITISPSESIVKTTTLPLVSTNISKKSSTTNAASTSGQRSTTQNVQPKSTTVKITTGTQNDGTTITAAKPIINPGVTKTATTKKFSSTTLDYFSIRTTMATDMDKKDKTTTLNPLIGSQTTVKADIKPVSVSEMPVTSSETALDTNSTLPVLTTVPAGELKTKSNVSIATTGLVITTVPAGELKTLSNASMATTGLTLTTVPAGDLETLSNVSVTTNFTMAITTSKQNTKTNALTISTESMKTKLNKTFTTSHNFPPINETTSIHTIRLSQNKTDDTSQIDKVISTSHVKDLMSSTTSPLMTTSKMIPTTKEPLETTSFPKSTQKTSTISNHDFSTVSSLLMKSFSENDKNVQTVTTKPFPINFPSTTSKLLTNKQPNLNMPSVTMPLLTTTTTATSLLAKSSPVVMTSSYSIKTSPFSSSTHIPSSTYKKTTVQPQLTTINKLPKILLSNIITASSNIARTNLPPFAKSQLKTQTISTLTPTSAPVQSSSTQNPKVISLSPTTEGLQTVRPPALMPFSTNSPKSILSTSTETGTQTLGTSVLLPTSTYSTKSTMTSFSKLNTQTVKSPVLLPTLLYNINSTLTLSTKSDLQSVISPSILEPSSTNKDVSTLAPSTNSNSQSFNPSTLVSSSTPNSGRSTLVRTTKVQTSSAPEIKQSTSPTPKTENKNHVKTIHKDEKSQTKPVSASFTQVVESTYQAGPDYEQVNQLSNNGEFSHMSKTTYHTNTEPQHHTLQTSTTTSVHKPIIQYIAKPDVKIQDTSTMIMAANGQPSSGATVTMGTADDKPLGTTFPYDPQCNKTQGCFHDCRGQFCTYLISWKDRGTEIDFQLKAVVPNLGDKWIAVGFSYDQHMGSDSVTECVTNRGQVSVYQSYNLDTHANARLRNPKFGLSNEAGSFIDGIFTCRFTRQKIVPAESRLFDLNKDWYILFAHGTAIAAMKLPHSYNPKPAVSNKLVDLQEYIRNVPTTTTTTTTLPPKTTTKSTRTSTTTPPTTTRRKTRRPITPSIITQKPTTKSYPKVVTSTTTTIKPPQILTIIEKDLKCGLIKGCYEKCRGDECSFIVSWNDQGSAIDFEIRAQVPQDNGDHWIAIGFSGDENMGNDNVIECISQDGMIDVYQSYNTGDKHNERLTQPKEGLSKIGGSLINGIFTCKFTRLKMIEGDDKAFNLNHNYYMMFANGKVSSGGTKERHSILKLPSVSNQLIDLQSHVEVSGHAKYYLIKLHGCLMIIGWIFFASIGIIVARFYRQMWPDHFWCKERIWYQVHRACMVTTLGCVIAGFILAFLDIRGYSQIDGKTFHQAHPVMGIIVTLLTITNPIIAMCRPLPGTTRRTVFDWLHRILGMSSHILAVITIFAGIELSKASAPDFMKYILMAYVGYQIIVTLVLEIHKFFSSRKEDIRNQTYLYEMHRKPYYTRQNNPSIDIDPPYSRTRKAILGSHVLIIFATTLILIILLLIY